MRRLNEEPRRPSRFYLLRGNRRAGKSVSSGGAELGAGASSSS